MEKSEIKCLFIEKGILNSKGLKKFCWMKYFDDEAQRVFEEFEKSYRTPDEAWFCLCRDVEPYICECCGKLAKFTGSTKSKILGYNTTCENCSANAAPEHLRNFHNTILKRTNSDKQRIKLKRRQTNLLLYGDENYNLFGSNSFKQNLLNKYGDKNYNNREKAKETCIKNFGYDNNFKNPEFQKQYLETKIKNNGNGNSSNYIKAKMTNLSLYGKEHIGQINDFQIKANSTKRKNIENTEQIYSCTLQSKVIKQYGQGWKKLDIEKIKINGHVYILNDDILKIKKYHADGYHTNKYTSKKEKDLASYIKSIYNGTIIENDSSVVSNYNHRFFELDIYLPDLNVAFDFNGTYWHSSKFKDVNYHHRKSKACYEQNIQLIHIYEYMWDNNKEFIKQKIQQFLNNRYSCIDINWLPIDEYNNYELSQPNCIKLNNLIIYDEGRFRKK